MKSLLLGLILMSVGISMIFIIGGAGMPETGSVLCFISIIIIIKALLKILWKRKE